MGDLGWVRVESGTEVGALGDWLRAEPELCGRVGRVVSPPAAGSLGGLGEVLVVAVGSGGVASVLASALVSWVRRRTGSAEVTVTLADGRSVVVRAVDVHGLDADSVAGLVAQVSGAIAEGSAGDG